MSRSYLITILCRNALLGFLGTLLAQMYNAKHTTFWPLLLIILTLVSSVSHAQEPTVPISLSIILEKSTPIKEDEVQVTIEVLPRIAVKNLHLLISSSKNISLQKRTEFNLGSLRANAKQIFTTKIKFSNEGRAILKGVVNVIDDNGVQFATASEIYFLIKKGETFYSRGDYINARIDSVRYRLRSVKLTPDAYKKIHDEAIRSITTDNSNTGPRNNSQNETKKSKNGAETNIVSPVIVSGIIRWTAPNGDKFPLKLAVIQIWDEDVTFPDLLTTVITDNNGFYSATVIGSAIDDPDIYVKVLAKSNYFYIAPESFGSDEDKTYSFKSAVYPDVTTLTISIPIDIPSDKTDDLSISVNAFSIHAALVESAGYVKTLSGMALPKLPVMFPVSGDVSNYDGNLNITKKRRFAWDVIHHEFGHYVADKLTLAGSLSLGDDTNHGPSQNLSGTGNPIRTKEKGMILAWSEGWPTYFGTSLQQRGIAIPSVGAGDFIYDNLDPDPLSRIKYNLESQNPYLSLGEDNELAIQRIIWDLYDGIDSGEKDEIALGDAEVWRIISAIHPMKLYDIWSPFTTGKPLSEVVKYGAVFAEHKVASLPTAPANTTMLTTLKDPVTFKWDANGAGSSYMNNKFTIEFWNKDFSKRLFVSRALATPEYVAPADTLKQKIFKTESEVRWFVKSSNTSTPVTGPYTSPAFTLSATPSGADVVFVVDDTGSMGEEINGVKQGIIQYLASFTTTPGSTSATVFQLVTFKDAPNTSRAATSDLNIIRSQVAALVASGGDDCPEGSIEAMLATDALVKDGGEVRLYTDADPHPGQTKESVVALYNKRGVKQSTILSGMCTSSPAAAAYEKEKGIIIPVSDNDSEKAPRATGPTTAASTTDSAIEAYSFIAQETGGTFVFFPEVNSGNPADLARYTNLVFNLLVGSISSAVTLIEPYTGPVGSTFMLTITGTKTNFNASSAVSFAGTGITIGTPTIQSATKIVVPITIASSATLGLKDITIVTTLAGGGTETAKGVGLFTVTAAPSTPTIVGITPVSGSTGQTLTVTVSGLNTHFTTNSVLTIGSGITVLSSTALSQGQLEAQIKIADNAVVGFRDVSVKTGSEIATENVTGPFLVTAAGCTPITIASVTVPSGGTATLTASGCAGTLLWSTGAVTSSIMVGPLTSSTAVSATCTTGSCVVAALGTITVLPATGGTFALTAPTYNCTTGAITFNTSGGDGSPIEYFAIGITNWSANPNQFVETGLRTDRKVIELKARQKGVEVSYTFDMPAFCAGGTPAGKLALVAPTYNCTTGAITFNTSGGDGSLIEYFAIGITNWSTNPNQTIDRELRADPKTVELKARQGGVVVSYIFDLPAACPSVPVPPSGKLALLAPTYNCASGAITFNTSGGDGSLIEYFAIGITNWSASPNQFVEPGLRTDRKVILLKARQKGVEVSYTFDMPAFCAGARLGATEPGTGLQVRVLGNPLEGKAARIVIGGVTGQAVQLILVNTQGQVLYQHTIEQVLADEQVNVPTQPGQGLLLLQVSTDRERQQIKLLKQ